MEQHQVPRSWSCFFCQVIFVFGKIPFLTMHCVVSWQSSCPAVLVGIWSIVRQRRLACAGWLCNNHPVTYLATTQCSILYASGHSQNLSKAETTPYWTEFGAEARHSRSQLDVNWSEYSALFPLRALIPTLWWRNAILCGYNRVLLPKQNYLRAIR